MGEDHVFIEILSQNLTVNMQTLLFQGKQPQNLDIQIIVRQRISRDVMGIISNVILTAFPLHRHSQRTANILSYKASQYTILIFFSCHLCHPPDLYTPVSFFLWVL